MGVPAFFRWLSKKYPSIVVHSVEEKVRFDICAFVRSAKVVVAQS